ncbi:MAG: 4a-hydroxytetrahydrobiopterin dehydratase [Pelagibacterales bacterium]|nr:4a-hydroxytetrahydrobiopterin dehydratase [Pelagibacterales bacterium]|tara:strand:- start:6105 stop:6389 length:285 start_codon:yes stop_codon:yes gene_type:complete
MEKNIQLFFSNNKWNFIDNDKKVNKLFNFKSFSEAFSWMTEVAFEAEKIDHHPDWTNIYNKVDVTLTTHDQNEITSKDLSLAEIMEKTFVKYNY